MSKQNSWAKPVLAVYLAFAVAICSQVRAFSDERDRDRNRAIGTSIGFSLGLSGKPAVEGDTNGDGVVDILDSSNSIDWLGENTGNPAWDVLYVWFDFNGNGEIDIYDVSHIAWLVDPDEEPTPEALLKRLIAKAGALPEQGYTADSRAALLEAAESAAIILGSNEAGENEIRAAVKALQRAFNALVEDVADPEPEPPEDRQATGMDEIDVPDETDNSDDVDPTQPDLSE